MKLDQDLREFIELLNFHGVEYLVVGAHCLAFHGVSRSTGDIDLFIRRSAENAARLVKAIGAFGFESIGLQSKDFLEPDQIIQLGIAPHRIDLLTGINAVSFESAWPARIPGQLDGLPVNYLSKDLFIQNKVAAGRPQDLADVERLRETMP